jgi:S-adenosylmethionine decarboxylase
VELTRQHWLYDLWLADPTPLCTVEPLCSQLTAALRASGATILDQRVHQFSPHGVTVLWLLAESHLSIHTWPEERLACIDLFTCGRMDAEAVITQIRQRLRPVAEQVQQLWRG